MPERCAIGPKVHDGLLPVSFGPMLFRLIRVILAAIGAAVVVAVIYAVVDLYMAGHGMGWTPERGDPWYYPVFGVLMFVAAITAGAVTWWRRD